MHEELKARLLAWTKTSSSFGLASIGKDIAAALEAIEQLERQLAERNAEIAKLIEAVADHVTVRAEQYAELQKYRDAPVVAWEFRWLDTNEHTVTSGQWSTWERVMPRNTITTVDDHVAEIQYWINKGYKYELRSLIVKPGE